MTSLSEGLDQESPRMKWLGRPGDVKSSGCLSRTVCMIRRLGILGQLVASTSRLGMATAAARP